MALISCPECKQEISDSANSCPHCGYPLPDNVEKVSDEALNYDPREERTHNSKGINSTGGLLIFGAVVFIFIMIISSGDGSSGGGSYDDGPAYDEIDAWIAAEDFVERRLKSPSTAEFPSINDADIQQDGKQFTISAYVDSENSFGGTVRKEFEIKVEYAGGGTWNLIDLEFK